jgi:hypothetical protein
VTETLLPKGYRNSDPARDQVFLRVRSTCSASGVRTGITLSNGQDTCFVNIVGDTGAHGSSPNSSGGMHRRGIVGIGLEEIRIALNELGRAASRRESRGPPGSSSGESEQRLKD